jgi:hypothetical protein
VGHGKFIAPKADQWKKSLPTFLMKLVYISVSFMRDWCHLAQQQPPTSVKQKLVALSDSHNFDVSASVYFLIPEGYLADVNRECRFSRRFIRIER